MPLPTMLIPYNHLKALKGNAYTHPDEQGTNIVVHGVVKIELQIVRQAMRSRNIEPNPTTPTI